MSVFVRRLGMRSFSWRQSELFISKNTGGRQSMLLGSSNTVSFFKRTPVYVSQSQSYSLEKAKSCSLDFSHPEQAFAGIPTLTLLRGWVILKLCSFRLLVQNSEQLLSVSRKLFGDSIVKLLVKPSFFAHFCAGEDEKEIIPTVHFLQQNGIGSILDFAAEADVQEEEEGEGFDNRLGVESARVYDYTTESACDQNLEIFENAIRAVHNVTPEGFAAIKITALGNPKLLERYSNALLAITELFNRLDKDCDGLLTRDEFISGYKSLFNSNESELQKVLEKFDIQEGKVIDIVDWTTKLKIEDMKQLSSQCIETGPFVNATLDDEEVELVRAMVVRATRLSELAAELDVRLLIDAEHSYFQPAIDNIVIELQRKYNTKMPYIFNTFQCYLKETEEKLNQHITRSEREGWIFACKLVRGAYMVLERTRAKEMGYASPIHDTIEDTHRCYNESLELIANRQRVKDGSELVNVMVATHNQRSVELAIEIISRNQISKDPKVTGIYFGQLFGMADNLTFSLGNAGFKAYKYLPYGPLVEVLPYLIRRAQENSSLMAGAHQERQMLAREIRRRLFRF